MRSAVDGFLWLDDDGFAPLGRPLDNRPAEGELLESSMAISLSLIIC
jgi:hypothetical protein